VTIGSNSTERKSIKDDVTGYKLVSEKPIDVKVSHL
jgi:hypothetical protein